MLSELLAAEKALLEDRPVLRAIVDEHGDMPALEYAQRFSRKGAAPDAGRAEELIAEIARRTGELLGPARAASVERQLRTHYVASTADHHGPLTHPFFVHGNLLAAAAGEDDPGYENVLVLATSNVSLGNSSWPRGLLLGSPEGTYLRANIFPARERHAPVYRHRSYEERDLARALSSMSDSPRARELIESVYAESFRLPGYAEQITVSNGRLWERMVPGKDLPALVYLELESIVLNLLQAHHLAARTPLHSLLFDAHVREQAYRVFDGAPGSHAAATGRGTFLFWYLPDGASRRQSLWLMGDRLSTRDGSFSIALAPEAIDEALRVRMLVPSTMLSLTTVSCYYGLTCLGGFSQVNYLTEFDRLYRTLFPEPERMLSEATRILGGDYGIALLGLPDGTRSLATGIDLALYGTDTTWCAFKEAAAALSVRDALRLMLPDLLLPETKRAGARTALLASLGRDIPPCASMS